MTTINKRGRHVGADLLRIVSMIMVVSLHTLGYTGGLSYDPNSAQFFFAWCLESLSYVAVNCFVLISSYFLIDSSFNKKKLISLWNQIVSFTIIIYAVLLLTGLAEVSLANLVKCIFPVISQAYWFITTYVCLYLISPYLNACIKNLNDSGLKKITIILLLIFSLLPTFFTFFGWDEAQGGNSLVWFVCLYFVAACLKRYQALSINKWWYLITYIMVSLLNVATMYIIPYVSKILGISKDYSHHFFQYNSIPVLIASIALFMFFINIDIIPSKYTTFINKVAGLTLSVYLFHMHPVLKNLYQTTFHVERLASQHYYFVYYILAVFAIFIVGVVLEFIRKQIIILFSIKFKH